MIRADPRDQFNQRLNGNHDLEDAFIRALQAEHRATVERIRERLLPPGYEAKYPWIRTILAQEAARSPITPSPDPQHTDRERLDLAKWALLGTGYFTADQIGNDIAPRITELWAGRKRKLKLKL